MVIFDSEKCFKYLHESNWDDLFKTISEYWENIKSEKNNDIEIYVDENLIYFIRIAFNEIIRVFESNKDYMEIHQAKSLHNYIEKLYLYAKEKYIGLGSELKVNYAKHFLLYFQNDPVIIYDFCKKNPNISFCKDFVETYEKEKKKKLNETDHSQSELISLKTNNDIEDVDYRKSIFNSRQEQEYFAAVKRIFDSYQVYPNVALSSILDFDKLESKLSKKEINFFFKSTVDLVVIDQAKNYLPIYFFELDSSFHDTIEQKQKDKMKDHIFSLSGQTLFRIEKKYDFIGVNEFDKLILEIREMTSI